MSRIVRWIAKYGILIGFLAAALGLIFGVRYFFERDLSAALSGAAGLAIGLAVGLPLANHLLRRKETRQAGVGMIEVSIRALSGDDGLSAKWTSGEVLVGRASLAFHRHWRFLKIRPSKEALSLRIEGQVDAPFKKPGRWEVLNHLNGGDEVLALDTPSGQIDVRSTDPAQDDSTAACAAC